MWHEILYRILSSINYVILILIAIPLLIQILYVLFSWVKKKTYPKSDKKAKIAFIIPAHNEDDVIEGTVSSIINNQQYPKELFDVFVVANNCTDKTAEKAKKAGAKVLILDDPDPAHHIPLYPIRYGIDHILSLDSYDMVIHVDADNHLSDDFSSLMNDAYQTGVEFARPYEGALNPTQNFYTKACTLFYTYDSRYGSRIRERLGFAALVNGSGAMMATSMLKKCGGYDAKTISDDAEFNFNRMLEGYQGHYVEDAVVYEDMPSSFKDTLNRNKRIFNGGMKLLKTKLLKILGKFFKTGKLTYLEIFCNYIFLFISLVVATWIPIYYIYHFTYLGLCGYEIIETTLHTSAYYYNVMWTTIWCAIGILGSLFLFFGIIQGLVLVIINYKKMGASSRKELLSATFLFPAFLFIYVITLCMGAFSKTKYTKVKRNTGTTS